VVSGCVWGREAAASNTTDAAVKRSKSFFIWDLKNCQKDSQPDDAGLSINKICLFQLNICDFNQRT
jgi:hypothetical protein